MAKEKLNLSLDTINKQKLIDQATKRGMNASEYVTFLVNVIDDNKDVTIKSKTKKVLVDNLFKL